ncbi:MAG: sulfatase [Pirellulaceae bacterium]
MLPPRLEFSQRIAAILLCLLTLGLASGTSAVRAADERPNIVFILVDDLRWDELGCTGHPFARTPNIDRIAREGARFRNAFCTTPLCSPSRGSILTGQHTHHHGILDNVDRSEHSHRLKTFPAMLQQAGYETAFIGKWHMGNDNTQRPGFDRWLALKGQGTSNDPEVNDDGVQKKLQGYTTDVLNENAAQFVAAKRDKPFCLFLAHKALHPELTQYDDGSISDPGAARFIPAERHENLYRNDPVPRRLNFFDGVEDKPALARKIDDLPPLSPKTATSDETIRDRLRMLAAVDEGVGMLLDRLQASGRLDDTVFVVTSDHGYWYGEHGLSVERRLPYEEAARIPLLVRYPEAIEAGSLIDAMALTIDFAPTLLELAGVKRPQSQDGRSLVPLLKGETPRSWRNEFLIEYNTDTVFPRVRKMGYKAIRTGRYKYVRYNELEGMDELYDLLADPYEMNNRIADPKLAGTLKELQQRLDKLLE